MPSKKPCYLGASPLYRDSRGTFFEIYKRSKFKNLPHFVQDNLSHSQAGVLRGLHAQNKSPQGKLVTVIGGKIFDVAVEIKTGAVTTFWLGMGQQIYVPPGYLHGFYCPIPSTVLYKTTAPYKKDDEIGVRWDDTYLNIAWPVKSPIVSVKDENWPPFKLLK